MTEGRGIPSSNDDPSLVTSYSAHRGSRHHSFGVSCVCFRPYMKHLVSGGADGKVLMWGLQSCHESRRQIRRPYCFEGHKAPVCSVAVSPLDTVVASGSKDKTLRLWVPRVHAKSSVIKGHSGSVRSVAFSPNGEYLLSASDDKCIKVWDVETEKFVFALLGHLNWVRSAEFNNSGSLIVSGSDDKTVRIWDVESRQCIHHYTDILGMVRSSRFHPESTCIASCGTDESIQIWDVRSKALVQHYAADSGIINSVSFHPSGNYLLSTCDDGGLRLWDLREGQLLYMLKGHEGSTNCGEFCKTGDFFASGSSDEQVFVWRSNFSNSRGQYPGILASALHESAAKTVHSVQHFDGAANKEKPENELETEMSTSNPVGEDLEQTFQGIMMQLNTLTQAVTSLEKRLHEKKAITTVSKAGEDGSDEE